MYTTGVILFLLALRAVFRLWMVGERTEGARRGFWRADLSDKKFVRRAADFEKELVENWARERWVWMHLLALAAIVLALALGW